MSLRAPSGLRRRMMARGAQDHGRRTNDSRALPAALVALVRRALADEEPETAALIRDLRRVRAHGAFTRAEFLAMCRWKTPRSAPQCARNRAAAIARMSAAVLERRDERGRMEGLLALRGVGVPTASAILTLVDPRRYGVLDIRAWRLLFESGCVSRNPSGVGFGVAHWLEYLGVLRALAAALGVSVRRVELTLYDLHRARQEGRLYRRAESGGRPKTRAQRLHR
jgi:hypothetical protein